MAVKVRATRRREAKKLAEGHRGVTTPGTETGGEILALGKSLGALLDLSGGRSTPSALLLVT